MKNRASFLGVLIVALVLLPTTALANAGTPLMWGTYLHLIFGNALIGLVEGLLLGFVFRCSKWKSILVLILANYASAWLGLVLLSSGIADSVEITIESLKFWFFLFVVGAFLLTLFIELPFFRFVLRGKEQVWKKTWLATVSIHGVSYLLLIAWYWGLSGTSMMTRLEVVSLEEMQPPDNYTLYYLPVEGAQVMQRPLRNASQLSELAKLEVGDESDRLFVRPRSEGGFDLLAFLHSDHLKTAQEVMVEEDFSPLAPVEWSIAKEEFSKPNTSWFNFGPVPSLVEGSAWEFRTGFWAVEGLSGSNKQTGEKIAYSVELPFVAWEIRNAVHLEGDYLFFQLGKDQLCLLHLPSKRIALLARGKGAVVALDQEPE